MAAETPEPEAEAQVIAEALAAANLQPTRPYLYLPEARAVLDAVHKHRRKEIKAGSVLILLQAAEAEGREHRAAGRMIDAAASAIRVQALKDALEALTGRRP